MRDCRYLEGENITPLDKSKVKTIIGHRIQYLRSVDIDRSGRGFFFPRTDVVVGSVGMNLELENGNNVSFSSLVEVVDLGVQK